MAEVNYLQIVRQTWDERFNMYMKCSKKELASMMAERDKYMCPEACKEFEKPYEPGKIETASTSSEIWTQE